MTENIKNEIRPCLIGGFHQLSEDFSSQFNPYQLSDGSRFSIDMVRISLSFSSNGGEWISEHAQSFLCDEVKAWVSKIKPGGWHELWNFSFGESSVSIGIGLIEKNCRVNIHRGFIEFNPNKLAGDGRFWKLLERVSHHVSKAELKRFDLALDVQRKRQDCRLSKDRRTYQAIISNGITEYLGVKNSPGFVKVYDKAAESNLHGVNLTRIELTCSGDWSAEEVVSHWPQVHRWSIDLIDQAPVRSKDWLRVLGILLAEKAEKNEEIESYISMLNWKQKLHARNFLRADFIILEKEFAEVSLNEARSWCKKLSK